MSKGFLGSLPDGIMTKSTRKYARTWRALAADVEARLQLGLEAVGYEPGILFRRPGGRSLTLDPELCLRIAALPLPRGWRQPDAKPGHPAKTGRVRP